MKPFFVAVALVATTCFASAEAWLTDYKAASAKAQTEKKTLLMDFTGSDWCGWCIKLDKEIFNTPEFKQYAKKNLVLLKLDFPRKKQLSAEEKAQNKELAQRYGIQGYPTIILLDGEGKNLGELGYMKGGPKAFIKEIEAKTK